MGQAEKTPGFNYKIPEKIMTPDTVATRIGTLKFVDGVHTDETAHLVYDNLDFLRGVEVFLNFIPAASIEGLRLGNVERGVFRSQSSIDLRSVARLRAAVADGQYGHGVLRRVSRPANGRATVVEIPPGCGPGTVNDAFFRFVVDMGESPAPTRARAANTSSFQTSIRASCRKMVTSSRAHRRT